MRLVARDRPFYKMIDGNPCLYIYLFRLLSVVFVKIKWLFSISCIRAKWPIRPELIPVSVALFHVLSPGSDTSQSQGYPLH